MNFEELARIARASGFEAWSPLDIRTLDLKPEVRQMCAGNSCGQYGRRWSCPPGCGTLEECRDRIQRFSQGILVQSVGIIEDSFDFEAMQETEARHKARFDAMYQLLRSHTAHVLAIGSGCCTHCKSCTYPDAPCRYPQRMVSSMEAYGMLVMEVCRANQMPYYYGAERIAFTGCFLL